MKISVCVEALYGQRLLEGIEDTARAGLDAIEFWGWTDKDIEAVEGRARACGLPVAAMCTRNFDLTNPTRRTAYLEGLHASIPVARRLGCPTLITQVGMDTGEPRALQHASVVSGLRAAAPTLEAEGITLVIEPLNLRVNHPGYYLYSSDEAFDMVKEVNSPRVKVLFDIYHQQITEGDVTARLLANIDWIGHFHAAGNPGRHELASGELNYRYILRMIAQTGYSGYVGLEYLPAGAPLEGLMDTAAMVREI